MNEISKFTHSEFGEIGVLVADGKEWFPASECATSLGYSNPRDAIVRHCRCVVKRDVPHPQNADKRIEKNFINEGDLYRLIVHSQLPAAERFERWVFDEILPNIRKHGLYATPQTIERMLADPDVMIATLQALKSERHGRLVAETRVEQQAQIIAEMEPKVTYCDLVLGCQDKLTVTQIAKDYGESPQWLNRKLKELGVQYSQRGTWLLYQKHAKMGYTKSKTVLCHDQWGNMYTQLQTLWTQKGRLFIYETLKAQGILPMIERDGDAA